MGWDKSPPQLIDAFEAAFPERPGVERRTMFGYPCGFVNGHMFGGLWQDTCVVRLPEARRVVLLELGGAPFVPSPGRSMKEYCTLPPQILSDPVRFAAWLYEACDYAATLPPKAPKKKRAPRRRVAARG